MKTIKHIEFLELTLKENNFFNDLYNNISTFKEYKAKIENLSLQFAKYNVIDRNKMIGNLFEIFAEQFIHILGSYPTIGITNYAPVKASDDNGVDGIGLGINGLPLAVQVKYRSNPMYELLADDVKQFGFVSLRKHNVDSHTKTNLVLFTSGKDLHWHTKENVFDNAIRVINNNTISSLVDNNMCFWNDMINMVNESKINLGI